MAWPAGNSVVPMQLSMVVELRGPKTHAPPGGEKRPCVPSPSDYRKQFIKAFESLAHHRERHDVFADFLEMAVCAIRKRTPPKYARNRPVTRLGSAYRR